jgi:hypothetical protein
VTGVTGRTLITSRGVVTSTTQLPAQAPATTSRDSVMQPSHRGQKPREGQTRSEEWGELQEDQFSCDAA